MFFIKRASASLALRVVEEGPEAVVNSFQAIGELWLAVSLRRCCSRYSGAYVIGNDSDRTLCGFIFSDCEIQKRFLSPNFLLISDRHHAVELAHQPNHGQAIFGLRGWLYSGTQAFGGHPDNRPYTSGDLPGSRSPGAGRTAVL